MRGLLLFLIVIAPASAYGQLKLEQAKGGWACWDMNELKPDERAAIGKAATVAADAIKRADFDALWTSADPALRDNYEREPLKKTIQSISMFLKDAKLPTDPSDIKVIRGEVKPSQWVYCWTHKPNGLNYRSLFGGKTPRALARFKLAEGTLFLELWQSTDRWGFFFVDFSPAPPGGRTAEGLLNGAAAALQKGDRWLAAFLYSQAIQMLGVSNSIFTHEQKVVDEKLSQLLMDAALRDQIASWKIDGKPYKILRTSFTVTSVDHKLLVIFSYQTALPLEKAPLEKEGNVLLKWLKAQHGDLAKFVDGVVFEAVGEISPRGATPSFRTVLHF
jgi:hypothetical protein